MSDETTIIALENRVKELEDRVKHVLTELNRLSDRFITSQKNVIEIYRTLSRSDKDHVELINELNDTIESNTRSIQGLHRLYIQIAELSSSSARDSQENDIFMITIPKKQDEEPN